MGMSLKNVEGRAEVSKVEKGVCFMPRVSRLLQFNNALRRLVGMGTSSQVAFRCDHLERFMSGMQSGGVQGLGLRLETAILKDPPAAKISDSFYG